MHPRHKDENILFFIGKLHMHVMSLELTILSSILLAMRDEHILILETNLGSTFIS